MRNLIDLVEAFDDDADDDASYELERHLIKLIHFAFQKIGLEISEGSYPVMIDLHTRSCSVDIEDATADGIPLTMLLKLHESGLAAGEYHIDVAGNGHGLAVNFTLHDALDHAQLPE